MSTGRRSGEPAAPHVLVISTADDRLASCVVRELGVRGAIVWALRSEQLLSDLRLSWRLGGPGWIELAGERLELSSVAGVLVRSSLAPAALDRDEADRAYVSAEALGTWIAVLTSVSCPVVNEPAGRSFSLRPGPWPDTPESELPSVSETLSDVLLGA